MRQRLLMSAGVAAVTAIVSLALATVAGQAPPSGAQASAAKAGPAPKLPWGEPDLQGIWRDDYQTPLQRPALYANKEFFTDEERAALDQQRAGNLSREANG